jgi:hypothetical protein
MKIGTKSILFGAHCFFIHPWFVALAYWRLYGFPADVRLWVAFFVHDLGYWGKPNMDGPEGEEHVRFGSWLMTKLFGDEWGYFCLLHSRFYAKKHDLDYSELCVADKLALAMTPRWLYLIQTNLTGEISEYMAGKGGRTPAGNRGQYQWITDVRDYCGAWAWEHRDLKQDHWTGTKRDLALK